MEKSLREVSIVQLLTLSERTNIAFMTDYKEYAITITYRCNWNCVYCAVRNSHDYKETLTREDVLRKIDLIQDKSNVTIFGGEPGLVERDLLEEYIERLKRKACTLFLETNGTFLRRYPDLVRQFKLVTYHCSCDLDDEIYMTDFENITYMLVVHDGNIRRLGDFLKKYPDMRFYIVEATYPYPEMNGPTLSPKNKNHLLTHFSGRMTKESVYRLINGKDFDKIEFLT